jgi:PIN domain nuclease of toxin-antitoxin system
LRLLLDTHALIWWFNGSPTLSRAAREAIADEANEVLVSAVSALEIATKHRLGKLSQADLLASRFEAMLADQAMTPLPITLAHGLLAGRLAIGHKDPFDRLLIAQSLVEDLPLVSNETIFDVAGVVRIW